MTTVILTIIGILLAAASALMIIYYGGNTLNGGSTNAKANTLINAGTNVLYGAQLARANDYSFSSISDLVSGNYINREPAFPLGLVSSMTATRYTLSNVTTSVCDRVNVNLKVPSSSVSGSYKMGCYNNAFEVNF